MTVRVLLGSLQAMAYTTNVYVLVDQSGSAYICVNNSRVHSFLTGRFTLYKFASPV